MPDVQEERIRLIFAQTNDYLRAADVKQLQLIGGFLGITAAVTAILADRTKGEQFLTPTPALFILGALLSITGYAVFVTLRWYRAWKVHYLRTLQAIVGAWTLPEDHLPFWMRVPKPGQKPTQSRWRVDDTFIYLVGILDFALVALTAYWLLRLLRTSTFVALTVTGVVATIYLGFLFWTYQGLFNDTRQLDA
jgi:hypothetical protein